MTQDTKDKSAEALSRLEMLLSLGWVVTSISRPDGLRFNDYNVFLANGLSTVRVLGCDPDLATAITRAINQAAQTDPTFRDFEIAVRG